MRIAALVILTLTGCAPVPIAQQSATASATSPATATATVFSPASARPTGTTALRPDAGFLVRDPASGLAPDWFVRAETDPKRVTVIRYAFAPAVSPDGTRVAYWRTGADGRPPATLVVHDLRARTGRDLVTLPNEGGGAIAWSPDGSSLALAINANEPAAQGIDAGPKYVALRVIEVAGDQPREIGRVTGGLFWVPIAYDRTAGIVGVVEGGAGGFAVNYVTLRHDGTLSRAPAGDRVLAFDVSASSDAQYMLSRSLDGDWLRFWPLADIAAAREVRPPSGERIWGAGWRPGTREIAMSVGPVDQAAARSGSRIELRDASSASVRVVSRSVPPTVIRFRYDGSALITSDLIVTSPTPSPKRMLDIATGVDGRLDVEEPFLAVSVRIA